jgi:hypothetical protein
MHKNLCTRAHFIVHLPFFSSSPPGPEHRGGNLFRKTVLEGMF